jgi:hypothetical protein
MSDETDSISGIKLVPNWLLMRQYQAQMPLFKGDLLMVKTDENITGGITYENLNNGWGLFYVTEDEAIDWEIENGFQ